MLLLARIMVQLASATALLCHLGQRSRLPDQTVPQSETGGARSAAAEAFAKSLCGVNDVAGSGGEEGDGFESSFTWFERL
jgi:hypothetical protein